MAESTTPAMWDGGLMANKPHASGGAFIDKRSGSCRSFRFDPKQRNHRIRLDEGRL